MKRLKQSKIHEIVIDTKRTEEQMDEAAEQVVPEQPVQHNTKQVRPEKPKTHAELFKAAR